MKKGMKTFKAECLNIQTGQKKTGYCNAMSSSEMFSIMEKAHYLVLSYEVTFEKK
jgi:hypothetical protein